MVSEITIDIFTKPNSSVAESGMFIRDPNFPISDPGSKRFRIRIKKFKYFLTQKIVSKLSEI